MEERKVKVKPNHNSNLHHLPLPLNKKNSMKMQIITTTTRIIEVTIEVTDPTGANIAVESHIEGLSKGEGDNKIITEANIKATIDNFIPPMVAIIIIIMAIIKAEVAVAIMVTIIDHVDVEEAITEAITIINTINITHMVMDSSSNNMVHHVLFAEVSIKQYGPPCALCSGFNHSPKHCFKGKHDINNLVEKMSLGSSNQHQNGLYQ